MQIILRQDTSVSQYFLSLCTAEQFDKSTVQINKSGKSSHIGSTKSVHHWLVKTVYPAKDN